MRPSRLIKHTTLKIDFIYYIGIKKRHTRSKETSGLSQKLEPNRKCVSSITWNRRTIIPPHSHSSRINFFLNKKTFYLYCVSCFTYPLILNAILIVSSFEFFSLFLFSLYFFFFLNFCIISQMLYSLIFFLSLNNKQ